MSVLYEISMFQMISVSKLYEIMFQIIPISVLYEISMFQISIMFVLYEIMFQIIPISVLYEISMFQLIPMSVLYGVFLFMGVSSMVGVQLIQRILIVFMPPKYQPDYMFLRTVPLRRVHMFTAVQVACLAVLWVIKTIKSISIVFPIMVGGVTLKYYPQFFL